MERLALDGAKQMEKYHHRKLPDHSTLLSGPAPRDAVGFMSSQLQIWYNNTDKSWVGLGEVPHKHLLCDECFIVLRGTLIVDVEGERFSVGPREFCCFPAGVYHAVIEVQPPVETLMIRVPLADDKVYKDQMENEK